MSSRRGRGRSVEAPPVAPSLPPSPPPPPPSEPDVPPEDVVDDPPTDALESTSRGVRSIDQGAINAAVVTALSDPGVLRSLTSAVQAVGGTSTGDSGPSGAVAGSSGTDGKCNVMFFSLFSGGSCLLPSQMISYCGLSCLLQDRPRSGNCRSPPK